MPPTTWIASQMSTSSPGPAITAPGTSQSWKPPRLPRPPTVNPSEPFRVVRTPTPPGPTGAATAPPPAGFPPSWEPPEPPEPDVGLSVEDTAGCDAPGDGVGVGLAIGSDGRG